MVADAYDFWLLDLDGTLVDVAESYRLERVSMVGDRLGCAFTELDAHRLWHGSTPVRERVLDGKGVTDEEFWRTFDRIDNPTARAEATYLYDDAAFLDDVDVPLGVVTHCPPEVTASVLDHLDVRDWFDAVVCCSHDLGWKPDPGPVNHTMRELGVAYNGHEGMLVGNGPSDVGAARNAGLDGIHVERHDPGRQGYCVLADYRVSRLDELDS